MTDLTKKIKELLNLAYESKEFDKVFAYCIEHVCLRTRIKDFHDKISKVVDFKQLEITPSAFRLAISKSGYVILNIKFYSMYLSKQTKLTDNDFEYYAKQFCISEDDTWALKYAYDVRIDRRKCRTILSSSFSDRETYSPSVKDKIVDDFTKMLPDIKKHINIKVNTKLYFLLKPNNMTRDEFVSELLFSAIKAHYYSHPNNNSIERQLGKIRLSITNYTTNLVYAYTSDKRKRLVCDGTDSKGNNVYSQIVVSENQIPKNSLTEDVDIPYDSMFSASLRLQMESRTEMEFCLLQVMEQYGLRSQQCKLARAFFKPNCFMLYKWLRKRGMLRGEGKTTQEFLDSKTVDEQLQILADYTKTTAESLRKVSLPSMARKFGIL